MSKISTYIVTLHRANNYGAILQAYALQKEVERYGFSNKLIDQRPRDKDLYQKLNDRSILSIIRTVAVNVNTFVHQATIRKQMDAFKRFVDTNLSLTSICCDAESAGRQCADASILITGSDQVINMRSPEIGMRLLDFCDDSVRRISYATDIMEMDLNQHERDYLVKRLSKYNAVSVRGKFTYEFINEVTGLTPQISLDPVFLLEKNEWMALAHKPQKLPNRYILFYSIGSNKGVDNVLKSIKEHYKLPIVCIQSAAKTRSRYVDKYYTEASVNEFLYMFIHADYVITSSFHGVAFSLIFEKQFIASMAINRPQRVLDMLEQVGLKNQTYHPSDVMDGIPEVNYEAVRSSLSEWIAKSKEYLRRSLGVDER